MRSCWMGGKIMEDFWLSKVCKSVETFDILFGMGFIQIIDAKRK